MKIIIIWFHQLKNFEFNEKTVELFKIQHPKEGANKIHAKFSNFNAFESDLLDFRLIFMTKKIQLNFNIFLSFLVHINFKPLSLIF